MSDNIEKIRRVKEQNFKTIFKKPNVVGVGIGRRIEKGEFTDELCLKVYVEKKLAKSQLDSKDMVEAEIDGVKTDVVGVGKIRFFQCNQHTRKRPAYGGDSSGSCHSLQYGYIMTGTLGCVVIDNTDGQRCVLSNNHVYADKDSDTETRAHVGDTLVQPGTMHGGSCTTDQIATLKRWIPFQTAGDNLVDAAIGDIITDSDVSNEIGCGIGLVNAIRELTSNDINTLQVQKCGQTTCYTTGTVIDIDATVDVGYEVLTNSGIDHRTYRFIHQILTTDMSDSGDSGSLIVDMNSKAVGLLFAGSNVITVANPIQTVFDELDVEFPKPTIHCFPGGPDKTLHCRVGPDAIPHCRIGGPDLDIHCVVGGPDNEIIRCYAGGPNNIDFCIIGGPGIGDELCPSGGPYLVRCLACGPDSPINCGTGGPDLLVDTLQCAAGPGLDLRIKLPVEDPKRLIVLDTAKIPRHMQKAFQELLIAMAEER
jgi:hypothetical protein